MELWNYGTMRLWDYALRDYGQKNNVKGTSGKFSDAKGEHITGDMLSK